MINLLQRIQYAKTKSDCIAKVDGTFVPREKKKKQEEKGDYLIYLSKCKALFYLSKKEFTCVTLFHNGEKIFCALVWSLTKRKQRGNSMMVLNAYYFLLGAIIQKSTILDVLVS